MTDFRNAAFAALVGLVLAFTVAADPAAANKGGVKPFTYGDCVSAAAVRGGARAFTEITAPQKSRGQGTRDEGKVACQGLEPGR